MSMMVRMPRPSSPTMTAQASSSSISTEALERLPSLSFRCWIEMALRSPSGVQRGSRKQEMPASVRARVRKASDIGAEQKYLCPVSRQDPSAPPPAGRARVELERTSEPPCFSVMNMPMVAPGLSSTGTSRPS